MITMSEHERSILKGQMDALKEASRKIWDMAEPFRAATDAIDAAREQLLDRYAAVIAGECDTCDRLLFEGERGFRSEDAGLVWCAECAPTWAEVKEEWDAAAKCDPDDEDAKAALAKIQAHVDSGGSLEDRLTHEL